MSGPIIEVMVDSNEAQWDRVAELEKAVAAHPDRYSWRGVAELPVDLRFREQSTHRCISVELKTPEDMVNSVTNGHLAMQMLSLREAGEIGFVVVTGSMKDTLAAIPRYTTAGRRTQPEVYGIFGQIRHFASAAYADGYPCFFWDFSWSQQLLAHINALFTVPTMLPYLQKNKQSLTGAAMLCMVPGVGATTAQGLIEAFGSLRGVMAATEAQIANTVVNGRKIGKKASAIVEALK